MRIRTIYIHIDCKFLLLESNLNCFPEISTVSAPILSSPCPAMAAGWWSGPGSLSFTHKSDSTTFHAKGLTFQGHCQFAESTTKSLKTQGETRAVHPSPKVHPRQMQWHHIDIWATRCLTITYNNHNPKPVHSSPVSLSSRQDTVTVPGHPPSDLGLWSIQDSQLMGLSTKSFTTWDDEYGILFIHQ